MGGVLKFIGPLKAPLFKLFNAVIKSKMGKSAEDLARVLEVVGDIVLDQVLAAQATGADSDAKHKQAAAEVVRIIREPGGIDFPEWINEYLDEYLDDLIKWGVETAKARGLFPS